MVHWFPGCVGEDESLGFDIPEGRSNRGGVPPQIVPV